MPVGSESEPGVCLTRTARLCLSLSVSVSHGLCLFLSVSVSGYIMVLVTGDHRMGAGPGQPGRRQVGRALRRRARARRLGEIDVLASALWHVGVRAAPSPSQEIRLNSMVVM